MRAATTLMVQRRTILALGREILRPVMSACTPRWPRRTRGAHRKMKRAARALRGGAAAARLIQNRRLSRMDAVKRGKWRAEKAQGDVRRYRHPCLGESGHRPFPGRGASASRRPARPSPGSPQSGLTVRPLARPRCEFVRHFSKLCRVLPLPLALAVRTRASHRRGGASAQLANGRCRHRSGAAYPGPSGAAGAFRRRRTPALFHSGRA